jgi:hypothetical protein
VQGHLRTCGRISIADRSNLQAATSPHGRCRVSASPPAKPSQPSSLEQVPDRLPRGDHHESIESSRLVHAQHLSIKGRRRDLNPMQVQGTGSQLTRPHPRVLIQSLPDGMPWFVRVSVRLR